MNKSEDIKKAHDAGVYWASSLAAGDLFIGASPAAKSAGFVDHAERGMFIHGALDKLIERWPNGVPCDENGVIK